MMMGAPMSGLPMVPSGGLYGMRAPYGVMVTTALHFMIHFFNLR